MEDSDRVKRIKMMLEDERDQRKRRAGQVTVDYQDVRAEHREECLRDVLRLWGPL